MTKKKTNFLSEMEEKFGEFINDIIISNDSPEEEIQVIPTGSLSLDCSIGIGGIPKGKITTIYGAESAGKSTLAIQIAKNAIAKGEKVIYIDVENQMDSNYLELLVGDDRLGSEIVLVKPKTGEDAFEIAEMAINSKEFGLVIFDSIGAVSPEKEMEDEFTDANVALVPRLMSKFLRRNSYNIRVNNIAFIFINQVRDSVGSYVKSYIMPGGHALKHYSSVIILLSKEADIKQGDEIIGVSAKFVIKKNKVGAPYRSFKFPIIFGEGIDYFRDFIQFAEMIGVLKKSGPYYKFEEITLASGLVKTAEYLKNNKEILDKIANTCYNITRNNIPKGEIEDEEDNLD